MNGRSWPHTERLVVPFGLAVEWRVINATVAQFAKDSIEAQRSLLTPLQRVAAYSAADFARLEALCANEPAQGYIALVEQNKLAEAEAKLPKDFPSADDAYAPLVFGLA